MRSIYFISGHFSLSQYWHYRNLNSHDDTNTYQSNKRRPPTSQMNNTSHKALYTISINLSHFNAREWYSHCTHWALPELVVHNQNHTHRCISDEPHTVRKIWLHYSFLVVTHITNYYMSSVTCCHSFWTPSSSHRNQFTVNKSTFQYSIIPENAPIFTHTHTSKHYGWMRI